MAKFVNCVVFIVLIGWACGVSAQSPCDGVQMPAGTICLTQSAANAAAQLAREAPVKDEKLKVLTEALAEKDKIIADVRATAAKNEADLKEALTRTQTELATKTGQLIGSDANQTRQLAIIDALLKVVRPKKIGLINF